MIPAIDPAATRVLLPNKLSSPVIGCRFDPSGRFLFAGLQDNSIQRLDLLTGKVTPFSGHESWVRGLAFVMPDAKLAVEKVAYEKARIATLALTRSVLPPSLPASPFTLISGDYHGKLIWWDGTAETPKPIRTVIAHDGWVRAVAVSPDGKTIASCGNDHSVKLWSAVDGKPLKTFTGHESHVYNVAFHPDGTRLASGDLKGIVKDWDLKKGTVVRDFDAKIFNKYDPTFMADIGGVRAMAFSPDGSKLACAGITNVTNAFAGIGNPLILLFDWKDGKATQLKPKDTFQGTAWGVGFHPAGWIVSAGGGAQGRIWFWKGDEPTSLHTITVPSSCRDLTLNPDGTNLAVANADGSARVFTMLPGPPAPVVPAPVKKK